MAVGECAAAWTSLGGSAGLWEAVMLGVTTETPAQHTAVATAVVKPQRAHGMQRRFMASVREARQNKFGASRRSQWTHRVQAKLNSVLSPGKVRRSRQVW